MNASFLLGAEAKAARHDRLPVLRQKHRALVTTDRTILLII